MYEKSPHLDNPHHRMSFEECPDVVQTISTNGLDTLPCELKVKILKYLPGMEINRCRQLSRRSANLINKYRLLGHNQLYFYQAHGTYDDHSNVTLHYTDSKDHSWHRSIEVGIDCMEMFYKEGLPKIETFYRPENPKAGEDFLCKILSMSTIGDFRLTSYVPSEFNKRFFDIVRETGCPIQRFTHPSLKGAEKVVNFIESSIYTGPFNFYVSLPYDDRKIDGFTSNDWDKIQRLASICNFGFHQLSLNRFLFLIQHTVETWLKRNLNQPFLLICRESEYEDFHFDSSGELMEPLFCRSDISFEGICLQDFRKIEYIAHFQARNFPRKFRIVRNSDKSCISFTRLRSGTGKFAVEFQK